MPLMVGTDARFLNELCGRWRALPPPQQWPPRQCAAATILSVKVAAKLLVVDVAAVVVTLIVQKPEVFLAYLASYVGAQFCSFVY